MTEDLTERLEAAEATGIIMEREAMDLMSALRLEDDYDTDWKQCCWNALKGSLDAALALAERVLPGWAWELYAAYEIKGVMKYGCNLGEEDTAYAPTPALALCIAILRARSALNTGSGEG